MNKLVDKSLMFLKRNSSIILTCIGGAGVVATTVMAVKATPKALTLLETATEEKGDELTTWEVVRTAGPVYIPSAVAGVATLACIFGANALNKRQQAALMSAYALIDSSYKEYKGKLKELYGEEAHDKIVDAIAIEQVNDEAVYATGPCGIYRQAINEDTGDEMLFYDEYGNRYFNSTIERVITAEYHLNRNFVLRGFSPLNEFYDFLGLEPTDYGSEVGWTAEDGVPWIDFHHHKAVSDDGLECCIIEIPFGPTVGYGD